MSFVFDGSLHSSKSLANRLLILKHIHPDLDVSYQSESDDVQNLEKMFQAFADGKTRFSVGDGGTSFRFFSFWISTHAGVWDMHLGEQLSRRPHAAILEILQQVGVRGEFIQPDHLRIYGQEWNLTQAVTIDLEASTQFFTGFLLTATKYSAPFQVKAKNASLASGYEEITLSLLQQWGYEFQIEKYANSGADDLIYKFKPTKPLQKSFVVGADWSSIFYLSLFAFLGADIKIKNADMQSVEPDRRGLKMLKACGLIYEINSEGELCIQPSKFKLSQMSFDFTKNPDLFPGFCALLAWALSPVGASLREESAVANATLDADLSLRFPWQLKIKESDRLTKSLEFLNLSGYKYSVDETAGMLIIQNKKAEALNITEFDTAFDHRLFMSAKFLNCAGFDFSIVEDVSYKKSFPEFMEIIGG